MWRTPHNMGVGGSPLRRIARDLSGEGAYTSRGWSSEAWWGISGTESSEGHSSLEPLNCKLYFINR